MGLKDTPTILVLGVGNLLYGDEGIGVHAARVLEEHYTFSENVRLEEGGTLGQFLLPSLTSCDIAIIIDAVCGGEAPGTLYRLEGGAVRNSLGFRDSQHQVDLADILVQCDLIGQKPQVVISGMEPQDIMTLQLEMTPLIASRQSKLIEHVIQEIEECGGKVFSRESTAL